MKIRRAASNQRWGYFAVSGSPDVVMRNLRKRFLDGHAMAASDVPPAVLRSWERARAAGLRPGDRALFSRPVSRTEASHIEEQHRQLIECAAPDMQLLWQSFANPNWTVICTDANGTILKALGSDNTAPRELRLPLRVGKELGEAELGTNAPACVVSERRAVEIYGAQHYLQELDTFVCAAAPIFNPRSEFVGVLDITGSRVQPKPGLLQSVLTSVRSIENSMFFRLPDLIVLRVHRDPRFIGTPLEGLLAVAQDGRVTAVNEAARFMLEQPHACLGRPIQELWVEAEHEDIGEIARSCVTPRAVHARSGGVFYLQAYVNQASGSGMRINRSLITQSATDASPSERELDAAIEHTLERASRVFGSGLPVLVQGETGTGKERFARTLHARHRPGKPFIAINCSAIPDTLIEAELFGYVDGAFTGGRRGGAKGQLEHADGGTLFLDEIGDMPLALQTRLLRVLQERTIVRIGGNTAVPIDVLVLSASHRDLAQQVAAGAFREDLYFRLAAFTAQLPPLRMRSDIESLIENIIAQYNPPIRVSGEALRALCAFHWPGNVRQLDQTLRAAVALCGESRVITLFDLPPELQRPSGEILEHNSAAKNTALNTLAERELQVVTSVLAEHNGNVSDAARSLGISRTTLYAKMRQIKKQSTN